MNPDLPCLLLATTNRGKLAELRALLADLPLQLVSLADVLPNQPPVPEDGLTFEENALIKARAAAKAANLLTLAEDAGLEVDALGGQPGVRSARYAGETATDQANNAKLLSALNGVKPDARRARFRCVMVLLEPRRPDHPILAEGRCEGWINEEPRGTGGFGYDPLFQVEGLNQTLAELGQDAKNEISHRSQAVLALKPALQALISRRDDQAPPP
ncbi:RdgB/HAM1 family non-canonical purine NTP pyrophosphatase [Chondromyces crocatus]|uniref:dITP/XTP pyrophosphatase n=1 Tax=Chondromyces crocatus TaxID=52 RepID=A0A0K1E6V8_CHOCO|nr:RdgB/HAM1 family non-canonical purine NTP pyrophosphatase [Chondromyces crocatus]AKT36606.1 nucleoside-triphosphate diphosphatase [Chondromyces crocatus]